jgi:hypothetical protein
MTILRKHWLFVLSAALLLAAGGAWAQHEVASGENSILPADHPAIQYFEAPVTDSAARLNEQIANGTAELEFDNAFGYLPSLLKHLGVNADSQMLVFSKTSFQAARISPRTPRAIFFNDTVTVGHVQDSDVLELAALDPKQGYVFYTFENLKSAKPSIDRRDVCLQCHHGPATSGVPGIMIASVYPDSSGMPYARLGMPVTDQRTRFQDRWGGWYVTGTHGGQNHRGNAVARDRQHPDLLESRDTQNIMDLSKRFDTAKYLSPYSDLIALMTLEHQTRMTNLLTRVGWEARMLGPGDVYKYYDPQNAPDTRVRTQLDADIESLVTCMLFADEARLLDTVAGASAFTKTFTERGPRDRQGRSLRDFDLEKRLFRFPLSYMIYSDVFDNLPDSVRERIYQRLYEVLSGKDRNEKFAKLSDEDRANILAIVRDTKPGLPEYWR